MLSAPFDTGCNAMTRFTPTLRALALSSAAAACLCAAVPGTAATNDPHVRGEVVALDGDVVTVRSVTGQDIEVSMAPDYTLLVYTDIELGDIGLDDYLGVPSAPAPGGGRRALSVVLFPEAMRGLNEGDAEWDLVPGSRMTNAALSAVKAVGEDRTLELLVGDDSMLVVVPESAPVVTFAPAPERRLDVGDAAILFASETGDGLEAGLAGVAENGELPPL